MSVPSPPPDIDSRNPAFVHLAKGTIVERIYTAAFDPIYFERDRSGRLSAPDRSYGVLYAAKNIHGAFAESFLRSPGRRLLPADEVRAKGRVRLRIARRLKLVNFSGPGLARLGATAEVVHGGLPYDAPQDWSRALYLHPMAPDGIAYMARHDDSALCYALFDRRPTSVLEGSRELDLDSQDWFWQLALQYGLGRAP